MTARHLTAVLLTTPLLGLIAYTVVDLHRDLPVAPEGPLAAAEVPRAASPVLPADLLRPASSAPVRARAARGSRRDETSNPPAVSDFPALSPVDDFPKATQRGSDPGSADFLPAEGSPTREGAAGPKQHDRQVAAVAGIASVGGVASRPAPVPVAQKLPLPLVFRDLDPVALGLTPAEEGLLDDLRKSFLREIGGESQNPNDPAYAKRWRAARPANDAQLRLFFGAQLAEQVALQAAQAEYAAAHPEYR